MRTPSLPLFFLLALTALVASAMTPTDSGTDATPSEARADAPVEASPETKPFGLERRVLWHDSRVVGTPDPPPPFTVERIFPNLEIFQPLTFDHEPGTANYLVIQHLGSWAPPGKILRVPNEPQTDAFEIALEMEGLAFGVAFHPDYETNGYLFVGHNTKDGEVHYTRVSRFTVDRQPPYRIDPESEVVIIEWESNGHNGGDLAFGADGTLFVSSGDGTSDSDTNLRGQDLSELTAKILRIDVDHPDPDRHYSVPPDNPFVDLPGARPETWAYGLRNPWRLHFDQKTGQLWAGNNGQDLWETAHLIEKGANYGWSVYEGSHPFQLHREMGPHPLTPPTVEHHHSEARSLTGGVVYHGARYPELQGSYIYGDWSTGKIWAVRHDGTQVVWHQEIADTTLQITGFGLDTDGELVVIDHQTGFYRLVPTPETAQPYPFPTRLSETGLFVSVADRTPHPALIPYSVNAPLWSDGALKERFLAIPGDGQIEFKTGGTGWEFPDGTVLVKSFFFNLDSDPDDEPSPIETRLLTRQNGEWVGYSYLWNDEGTDATLVGRDGLDRTFPVRDREAPGGVRQQSWRYPSRTECMVCHSRAANFVLGLSDLQMNKDHDYGGVIDNQLRAFEHVGLFQEPLPECPEAMPKLVDPYDDTEDLELRARSYLHVNCASCHVLAGGGNALMELAFSTDRDQMNLLDAMPQHHTFDIEDARLVAPGDPEKSVLYHRITRRGEGQMPPLATSVVDQKAARLFFDWITQVEPPTGEESDPSE